MNANFKNPLPPKLSLPANTKFHKGTPIIFAGKKYPSKKALAAAFDLTAKTIYTRLHAGRTGKDLVTPPERHAFPGVKIDGKIFTVLAALADAYGLPHSLVSNRFWGEGLRGKALVAPHRRRPSVCIRPVVSGITYPSLAAACLEVGVVAYNTAKQRIFFSGWTPVEALLTPIGQRPARLARVRRAPE